MRNQITAGENFTLHLGDNLATLKNYPDNTFDSIVCDPPYFIDFLGKDWDSSKNDFTPLFKECLRVLKPGGYLLAFSAPRTYHKTATMIENAGFEIRDQINWIFSSGFPKAQDIGKAIQKRLGVEETATNKWASQATLTNVLSEAAGVQRLNTSKGDESARQGNVQQPVCTSPLAKEWEGYKTALKPAAENICMARKPFKGSTIDNVLKNGLGAMNIDATRVPWADENDGAELIEWTRKRKEDLGNTKATFQYLGDVGGNTGNERPRYERITESRKKKKSDKPKPQKLPPKGHTGYELFKTHAEYQPAIDTELSVVHDGGRYPSNVIGEVDEGYQKTDIQKYFYNPAYTAEEVIPEVEDGYPKFKYCPKVSRKERHVGFAPDTPLTEIAEAKGCTKIGGNLWKLPDGNTCADNGLRWNLEKLFGPIPALNVGNNHPTVKPVALMDYLIKLVTPPSTPTLQRKVLDPFMGSGSTGMAATALGHHFTGCELDPKYVEIAKTRIEAWNKTDEAANDAQLPDQFFGT